ncbi:hypothetical protein EG329_012588 [Mollisiaceae sp. DMI_Dod_QoI]|nr:hypothetical protein EG329_012588 [Helotiales sp. DMI_Dod_QoI]
MVFASGVERVQHEHQQPQPELRTVMKTSANTSTEDKELKTSVSNLKSRHSLYESSGIATSSFTGPGTLIGICRSRQLPNSRGCRSSVPIQAVMYHAARNFHGHIPPGSSGEAQVIYTALAINLKILIVHIWNGRLISVVNTPLIPLFHPADRTLQHLPIFEEFISIVIISISPVSASNFP